ncbi:MAG: hypothetical protein V4440_03840 [Pseudomonadota bacterium]
MRKILYSLILLIFSSTCQASVVTTPYVYSVGDTVTNVKLNSNQNAVTNVVNGGLDNTNANTTNGYRFFQTVAALPSAGSQGAVYFLTSDNSLNFDTGSAFGKVSAGLTMPSGAAFFMLTGSCPSGSTDITATYSDKFLKVNSTQGTTSGPVLTATTDSHTLSVAEVPALSVTIPLYTANSGGNSGVPQNTPGPTDSSNSYTTTGGGGGHTHTISTPTTLEPASVTVKLCQVN